VYHTFYAMRTAEGKASGEQGKAMRYHNLVWDFDGMLFDSYPHIHAAYTKALADFGRTVDSATLMARLKIHFNAAHEYVQATDEIRARFREYEHDLDFEPRAMLYDGMKELLHDARAAGARHFLFTNRGHLALTHMERAGILDLFTGCVTADDKENFEPKPSSKAILYLLDTYGIPAEDCVMIGDREIDIGSGCAAGIRGILFDEFRNLGETAAQHRVYSIAELRELLLDHEGEKETGGLSSPWRDSRGRWRKEKTRGSGCH